jgi:hypothetical protein
MKKKKTKKLGWIDLKKAVIKFDHSQLVDIVKDLFQLSEENKTFLYARCLDGSESLKRYKKVILNCLYPDVMDEKDFFDFDRADKAINDYVKATADDEGSADLMIYYVECGNKFTLDYGDVDEFFYDALIEMFERAIKIVTKIPEKRQRPFRKRLEKIMKSSDGIGWGYHDDLCHFFYNAFQS